MAKKSNSQGSRRSSSKKSSNASKCGSRSIDSNTSIRTNKTGKTNKTNNSGVGPSSFSKRELFQIIRIQSLNGKNVRLEYRNPNFDVSNFSRSSIEEEAARVRGNKTWGEFRRVVK